MAKKNNTGRSQPKNKTVNKQQSSPITEDTPTPVTESKAASRQEDLPQVNDKTIDEVPQQQNHPETSETQQTDTRHLVAQPTVQVENPHAALSEQQHVVSPQVEIIDSLASLASADTLTNSDSHVQSTQHSNPIQESLLAHTNDIIGADNVDKVNEVEIIERVDEGHHKVEHLAGKAQHDEPTPSTPPQSEPATQKVQISSSETHSEHASITVESVKQLIANNYPKVIEMVKEKGQVLMKALMKALNK